MTLGKSHFSTGQIFLNKVLKATTAICEVHKNKGMATYTKRRMWMAFHKIITLLGLRRCVFKKSFLTYVYGYFFP